MCLPLTAEQHPPVGNGFTCYSGNSVKAQILISDPTLLLFLHCGAKPSRHKMNILTMTPHIFTSLAHYGLFMGSPDCACKHSDKLAEVHHLIRWYYSSILDKKNKVLLEFVYLPWPQLCPSVRVEWMMCLADWVEMTFRIFVGLRFFTTHSDRQRQRDEGRVMMRRDHCMVWRTAMA